MKLLFLTTHLSPTNGWGKVAVEIIRRFARDGHQVEVLTDDDCRFDDSNVAVTRRKRFVSKEGRRSRRFKLLLESLRFANLRNRDFDLLFCLTEDVLPLAAKLVNAKRKLVCFAHGTYSITSLRGHNRSLYLQAFDRCDLILCNSEYTKTQLNSVADGRLSERSRVIPLGCNPTLSEKEYRETICGRQDLVISVGQLKPRKAILESLRAFNEFRKLFPEYQFHLIGDTRLEGYVSQIRELISELELESAVRIVGKADAERLRDYYKRAKLLLMPSINANDHFEGFGLVHLEANSWGTPTIGSFDCGHEQAIEDGVSGRLTPQGDIPAIRDAMVEILGTNESWKQYSRRAFEFSLTMSWDAFYSTCAELIDQVVVTSKARTDSSRHVSSRDRL